MYMKSSNTQILYTNSSNVQKNLIHTKGLSKQPTTVIIITIFHCGFSHNLNNLPSCTFNPYLKNIMWEACKSFNITTLVGVKHTEQMNTQAGQNKKQGRVFIYYYYMHASPDEVPALHNYTNHNEVQGGWGGGGGNRHQWSHNTFFKPMKVVNDQIITETSHIHSCLKLS